MKQINNFINEKLIINKNIKINKYHYHPKDADELYHLIVQLLKERDDEANLNDIDTSKIIEMTELFYNLKNFDGNISEWDVSNVEDMTSMFENTNFTGKNTDFSNWNISKLKCTIDMFRNSKFNGDISNWDVSNVEDMDNMLRNCPLEKNPPKWYKE